MTQNQDPALSQVVKWLKTGVRSPRGDVDGEGGGGGANCYCTGHNTEKELKRPYSFKKTKQLFRTEILYNANVKVMVLITNQLYFHLTFPPYPKNLIRT